MQKDRNKERKEVGKCGEVTSVKAKYRLETRLTKQRRRKL